MAELKYEITREIGSIGESARGWSKELNLVSWNDREAKYDLREWSPDHSRMGKGVTMTLDELIMLKKLLNAMDELNVEVSDSFDSDEFDV